MKFNVALSRIFSCIALLTIASLLLAACGGQTLPGAQKDQAAIITQKAGNVDEVHSKSTPTETRSSADAVVTPSATPTEPPTTVTVSWATPATVYTLGQTNLRSTPFTSGTILETVDAGKALTVYGTVNGEILSSGATWYRVSDQNSAPQYVYSSLITTSRPAPTNDGSGKVIKVNLSTQHIYAYDNGNLVRDNLVSTGQPGLLTPAGTFHIISKLSPTTFYSPWPPSSPYYYAPLHINYALGFQGTLLFIHDAYWRGNDFGPGTNVPHTAANGTQMTGSHGCVEISTANAAWFYNWAPIGTPLIISY